jgi:hypothetical protein
MGFKKPDLDQARSAIGSCLVEIASPYNDGWTASSCKHDLYLLKSWLDEEYARLPKFSGEESWDYERVINILKKN